MTSWATLLYGGMGVFHYIFRRRFRNPTDPEQAEAQGITFATRFFFLRIVRFCRDLVVAIAGVLLVFCYLIVPSVELCCSQTALARDWRSADHGHLVSALGVLFGTAGSSDRGNHRLHLRGGTHCHVPDPPLVLPWSGARLAGAASAGARRNDFAAGTIGLPLKL